MSVKRILSGIRTTGPLHLGHYFGAIKSWVELQDGYECYFILADIQALTTHFDRLNLVEESMLEVVLDLLACGIDPNKSTIFMQSKIIELHELTSYFGLITPLKDLEDNPTIKSELKQQKKIYYGFMGYPVSQCSDILLFSPTPPKSGDELLIPVGEDQVPHIELTKTTARRFNSQFGRDVFVIPSAYVSQIARLPGLNMGQKMSKSLDNAIFLKDSPEIIREKVNQAYTDSKKIKVDDPGNPEGCAIYNYYKVINPDFAEKVYSDCQSGLMGCSYDKNRFTEQLVAFLEPIRKEREKYQNDLGYVKQVLLNGNRNANRVARKTIKFVRQAMHLDYKNILT